MPALFLMGEHLQDHVLRCLDNRSTIHDQLSLYLRLLIDVTTYEVQMKLYPTTIYCVFIVYNDSAFYFLLEHEE